MEGLKFLSHELGDFYIVEHPETLLLCFPLYFFFIKKNTRGKQKEENYIETCLCAKFNNW